MLQMTNISGPSKVMMAIIVKIKLPIFYRKTELCGANLTCEGFIQLLTLPL